jgi:hypothetical protein
VFNDPDASVTHQWIHGGGYDCEIGDGYSGFRINKEDNFTPYQKIIFFQRLYKWELWKKLNDTRLHKHKLADAVFKKQLDSLLDKERSD